MVHACTRTWSYASEGGTRSDERFQHIAGNTLGRPAAAGPPRQDSLPEPI